MTYKQLLAKAEKMIQNTNKDINSLRFLLVELSGLSGAEFYLQYQNETSEEFTREFISLATSHIEDDIPVQYLLGYAYFYGRKFLVNKSVLIPRNETEELVEYVLQYYQEYFPNQKVKVLDLCTGSGCIGLTLALEEEKMEVYLSDISREALEVVEENKMMLGARVNIMESDLFENIVDKFDIIVSNPPYIPKGETVQDVVQIEPKLALYGGDEGLDFYNKILQDSANFLNEKGLIAFEHGWQQKKQIYKIISTHFPGAKIIQKPDMNGKDRMTFVGLKGVLK